MSHEVQNATAGSLVHRHPPSVGFRFASGNILIRLAAHLGDALGWGHVSFTIERAFSVLFVYVGEPRSGAQRRISRSSTGARAAYRRRNLGHLARESRHSGFSARARRNFRFRIRRLRGYEGSSSGRSAADGRPEPGKVFTGTGPVRRSRGSGAKRSWLRPAPGRRPATSCRTAFCVKSVFGPHAERLPAGGSRPSATSCLAVLAVRPNFGFYENAVDRR